MTLEHDGNIRLYIWDDNISFRWFANRVVVLYPCTNATICGNGICSIDSKVNPHHNFTLGSNLVD